MRKKEPEKEQVERRKYVRIKKNFVMSYHDVGNPSIKKIATQLKNIGKGGLCFITDRAYAPSTVIKIELRTPYLADVTEFEGTVLESHEKVPNIIYETRLQFGELSSQANFLLEKLEEFFVKQSKG